MSYVEFESLSGLGATGTVTDYQARAIAIINNLNATLAAALRPLGPAIDAAPNIPNAYKTQLKSRPVDALMELFRPVEKIIWAAIDDVRMSNLPDGGRGAETRTIMLPTRTLVVPTRITLPGDSSVPRDIRRWIQRMRAIALFMLYVKVAPIALAAALAKNTGKSIWTTGLSAASRALAALRKFASNLPPPGMLVPSLPNVPSPGKVANTVKNALPDVPKPPSISLPRIGYFGADEYENTEAIALDSGTEDTSTPDATSSEGQDSGTAAATGTGEAVGTTAAPVILDALTQLLKLDKDLKLSEGAVKQLDNVNMNPSLPGGNTVNASPPPAEKASNDTAMLLGLAGLGIAAMLLLKR